MALAMPKVAQCIPVVPATMPFSWRSSTTNRAKTTISGPRFRAIASARSSCAAPKPKCLPNAQDHRPPQLPPDQVADIVPEHRPGESAASATARMSSLPSAAAAEAKTIADFPGTGAPSASSVTHDEKRDRAVGGDETLRPSARSRASRPPRRPSAATIASPAPRFPPGSLHRRYPAGSRPFNS